MKIVLKKGFLFTLMLVVLQIAFVASASAATTVEEDISTTTKWTVTGSPYVIEDSITVEEEVSLTIDPGVVVKFKTGNSLTVYGTLYAPGTAAAPIYFTSYKDDAAGGDTNGDGPATTAAAGDWQDIQVRDNGSATFNYCNIQYNGASAEECSVFKYGSGNLTMANTTISDGKYDGLYVYDSSGTQTLNNCTFKDLGRYGIKLDSITDYFKGSDNTIDNNDTNPKVYIDGGDTDKAVTFEKEYSPYYIGESLTVSEETSLTIKEGVVLKFPTNRCLVVNGTLNAQGTVAEPIYFTSSKDDAAGGDTNDDGTLTTPVAGDWEGIQVTGSGSATINHSVIRYSGGGYDQYCLYKYGPGNLTLTNSTVSDNKNDGIYLYDSTGTHSITNNTIRDNGGAGIYLDSSAEANIFNNRICNNKTGITCESDCLPTIGGSAANANKIYNNELYGVQNLDTDSTDSVNARYNWWGDPSGPDHVTNPQGKGDAVSDKVAYQNYVTQGPKAWPAKTAVSAAKDWTIKFNHSVDANSVNSQNIYVLDAANTKVTGVVVALGNDSKSVVVESPANGYQRGQTYTLYIEGVKSASGKNLSSDITMEFTIAP